MASHCHLRVGLRVPSAHQANRGPLPTLFAVVPDAESRKLEDTYHMSWPMRRLPIGSQESWLYLVVLLQFWMDNNVTSRLLGSPVQPISPLANVVKETANLILPKGFHIRWKNVVEDTPWYRHRDFAKLLPTSPDPVNRLDKAMRLYHEKMEKKLRQTWASRQGRASHSPVAETTDARRPEEIEPINGQFDDEDLDHDVFDPLETPTTTPVQDEGQAPTVPLEPQSATSSQGVENAPTS